MAAYEPRPLVLRSPSEVRFVRPGESLAMDTTAAQGGGESVLRGTYGGIDPSGRRLALRTEGTAPLAVELGSVRRVRLEGDGRAWPWARRWAFAGATTGLALSLLESLLIPGRPGTTSGNAFAAFVTFGTVGGVLGLVSGAIAGPEEHMLELAPGPWSIDASD